jgi:hypothetical protein
MQAVPNTPDSFIHKGYLQQQGTDTTALMQNLLQTAPWNKRDNPAMMMRGHKLKRTKFFAFAHEDPNLLLKYGYTAFPEAAQDPYQGGDARNAHQRLSSCIQPHNRYAVCRTEGRNWSAPR